MEMNKDYFSSDKVNELTYEDFKKTIERIFRKKTPLPEWPKQYVDFKLLYEHGIGHFYDPLADMYMFSSTGMQKAREIGAIIVEYGPNGEGKVSEEQLKELDKLIKEYESD
jgi:hypothetical protein